MFLKFVKMRLLPPSSKSFHNRMDSIEYMLRKGNENQGRIDNPLSKSLHERMDTLEHILRKNIANQEAINNLLTNKVEKKFDSNDIRLETLRYLSNQISSEKVSGEVAEAGVFCGNFARHINKYFPEKNLFLYDTYDGFDERDVIKELDRFPEDADWLKRCAEHFRNAEMTPENQIKFILHNMPFPERCVFRKGYFPESANEDTERRFAYVSIDMDLYQPNMEAILFFYPRLNSGGFIMLHDYNEGGLAGNKHAVLDAEKMLGKLIKIPIAEGSVIIAKP